MTTTIPPVPAQWTDDCQGKKDYDGKLVSLSTRYWPRGGSWFLINTDTGETSDTNDPQRQGIRPSAHATIYLGSTANDFYDDAITLTEQEFEGETQEDVQRAVESWAAEQFARIASTLRHEFGL